MRAFTPAPLAALLASAALAAACGAGETIVEPDIPTDECPALIEDTLVPAPTAPDGATECATGSCNYQTQEGCAEDEACRPQFNSNDPEVNPGCEVAGEGQAGDACEQPSDCGRGLYCAEGACRQQCCGGDWSACGPGESCIRSLQVRAGGEVLDAGMDLCFPVGTCDLFDADSCEDAARECKVVDPTGAVACAPRSTADVGDPCAPPTVCKQGLACVGGTCIKLCSFVECGDVRCGDGEGTCVHFERDPPGVGECTLGR